MPLLATMVVEYVANTAGLIQGIQGVTNAHKSATSAAKGFAAASVPVIAAIGAAAIGAGVAATKMAADFQSGMTGLVTGAGEAQSNIKMVGDGILAMAPKVGMTTKALTDGMFNVESAGFRGADALNVLEAAAKGARTGGADLATTTNALTTIMTDYHMSGDQAVQATNALMSASASGKMTLQDLAGSMGTVLPLASSLGISFPQVGAAISVMTNAGMGAQRASQNLANTIRALAAPNSAAEKSMKAVGISAQELKNALSSGGLPAAIQMIEEHVNSTFPAGSVKAVQAFKTIMGGATGYNTALMLGGKNMDAFKTNVESISGALNGGNKEIMGWSKVQNDFNLKMDQAKATVETLGIKIGMALLPAASNLLATVLPIITTFGNWLVSSGVLVTVFNGLSAAITTVTNVVKNVVTFFQQNEAALTALKIAAIAVGGAVIALLVVGFIAWAVAAGAAAIATLAATWPILLIGAIIALVVAGIILAIQNWGAIVGWLGGVWNAFIAWFMGILGAIGAFFTGLWTGIANFFTGIWNGIVAGLTAAWNFIVNAARVAFQLLLMIILGPIIGIAQGFIWLYNHNYYFQALVDFIVNIFRGCFAWLQGAWGAIVGFLTGLWQRLSGVAMAVWGAISSFIMGIVGGVVGWLRGVWQGAVSLIGSLWSSLKGLASRAWNAVTGVFRSAWGSISGALSGLWNNISKWFKDLATQAIQFGKNIIQGFIDGIRAMIGAVGKAAGDVVNAAKNFLGFHSPTKEGPGREADKWAPAFVDMYAKGIEAGIPRIEAAVNRIMTPIAFRIGGLNIKGSDSPVMSAAKGAGGSAGTEEKEIHVHIYLDGREMTDQIMERATRQMIKQGVH